MNSHLPEPADRPPADERRKSVDGRLAKSKRNGGHGELFAMAYEDIALTDQPHGSHDQCGPIGIGHEAAHKIDGKAQKWSRFFAYEPTIHRSRTDRFPVQDVDIPGDVVARGQRPELLADEFTKSALPRHRLRFLRVGQLVLGKRARNTSRYSPSLVLKW